ncbi:hypothetical protein HPB47_006326 [Ixodes persulcatus]|uniref:Uncharacterized protein n=1 Tax=Ixodes persulcatus TaxID=34615 RepID=A0AC60PAS8_IXOPE|nr:hypothetical protein HPB47_006326 [Ixodes persulcatus]
MNPGAVSERTPGDDSSKILRQPYNCELLMTAQPDTGGSDHVPIRLTHPRAPPKNLKVCKVTNWDLFRQYLSSAIVGSNYDDLTTCIAECLRLSTRSVTVQLQAPLLTLSGLTYEQPDGRHNEGRLTPTPHGTRLATTELTLNSGDTPRHFSGGNGARTAHRMVVQVEASALGRSLEPSPVRRFHDTLLQDLKYARDFNVAVNCYVSLDSLEAPPGVHPNVHYFKCTKGSSCPGCSIHCHYWLLQGHKSETSILFTAENVATIVAAEEWPLSLRLERALRNIAQIHETLPIPQRKANVPAFVARSIALERIDEVYKGWIHVYSDASINLTKRTATAHRFIREILTERHPHPGVATGRPPPVVPRKLPKAETSLLHRLRAGFPYTAMRLHMMRRKADPNCPTCGDPEDTEHALLKGTVVQAISPTLKVWQSFTMEALPAKMAPTGRSKTQARQKEVLKIRLPDWGETKETARGCRGRTHLARTAGAGETTRVVETTQTCKSSRGAPQSFLANHQTIRGRQLKKRKRVDYRLRMRCNVCRGMSRNARTANPVDSDRTGALGHKPMKVCRHTEGVINTT